MQFEKEVDQLNAFYASYKSAINVRRLDSLGFIERNFPKIENMTPDFLFFKEGYAFIVECKSGVLTDKDAVQLRSYLSFDVKNIERTVQRSARRKYPVYRYDVFLVLWEEVYEKEKVGVLRITKDHNLNSLKVLTIRKGGLLKMQQGFIENCQELNVLLQQGIRIPHRPKNEIFVTPTIPTEGIMVYLIREFTLIKSHENYVRVDASEIYNDWFRSYEIKFNRIKDALQYLVKLNILEEESQNKYLFSKKTIREAYDVISKLSSHNVTDLLRPPRTRPLDDYMNKQG